MTSQYLTQGEYHLSIGSFVARINESQKRQGRRMTKKDLKRLGRRELLEMMIAISRKNQALQEENESLRKQIDKKMLQMNESETLADAILKVNGIVDAADRSAKQYYERVEIYAEKMRKQKLEEFERISNEAERVVQMALEERNRQKMLAEQYCSTLPDRLGVFFDEHPGLREMLNVQTV